MSEEAKIILEEPVVEQEVDFSEEATDGLTEKEIQAGKDLGIIKDKSDKPADKSADKTEVKEEPKGEKPAPTFETMEEVFSKDEGKFHKDFNANEKALYFKFKRNKQLRQEAQEQAEKAVKEKEFLTAKEKAYVKQLAEVTDILDKIDAGDERITTADIRKVIAFNKELAEKKEEEPKNEKENAEREQRYLQDKAKNTELLGKSKHEDFERIVELANEVVSQDKDVAVLITKAYRDQEVDEEQLVEKIVKVARMNPKFYEKESEKSEKKEKQDVDRIVANAQKKKTSASLTTGSGRRELSYDELTPADVPRMTQSQWNSLPKPVRDRLMKEVG